MVFDELVRIRNKAARDIDLLRSSAKWSLVGLGLLVPGVLFVILFGDVAMCVLVSALFTYAIGIVQFLAAICIIVVGSFQENRREQLAAFQVVRWVMFNVLIGLPLLLLMMSRSC